MKDAYVKRRWIACGLAWTVVFGGWLSTPVLAQTDETPPEDQISYSEAIERTLTRMFELTDHLEDTRKIDDAWRADYTEVAKRTNSILEVDPLNLRANYIQGRLAIMQGKPRDALPLIQAYASSKVGATDWKAHKLLGDLNLVSYAELARTEYAQAARLAPEEPEPLIGLARALTKLNRGEEAVAKARDAIRNDKNDDATYRQVLAKALLLLDDQQRQAVEAARESVQITERKIRENPDDLSLFNELKAGYELLLQCCNARFKVERDNPAVLVDVARTMQDQADLQRLISYHNALSMVTEARKRQALHDDPELMFEEARLSRLLGRNDRAVEVLQELLAAHPDHAAGRELLDVIEAAGSDAAGADLSTVSGRG